ncbi:hypothetical protein V6M85_03170 [Sulfolobus tengchongensis]|uniref:Uncharacterized protein n=1 Tax=Sulfolobus tengchongensis TaxID=207809 RepID=A0AAX4L2H5_9CREN
MSESDKEKPQSQRFLSSIVDLLAELAKDKVYGILDTFAYVSNLSIVYASLYNAIRYLASKEEYKDKIPSEDELNKLFGIARENPTILREVAIRALARALKPQGEGEE